MTQEQAAARADRAYAEAQESAALSRGLKPGEAITTARQAIDTETWRRQSAPTGLPARATAASAAARMAAAALLQVYGPTETVDALYEALAHWQPPRPRDVPDVATGSKVATMRRIHGTPDKPAPANSIAEIGNGIYVRTGTGKRKAKGNQR